MVIPHSTIPISTIRPTDILLLLTIGSISEILKRLILRSAKSRTSSEKDLIEQLRIVRFQTRKKREQGPGSFVECAKLERIVLAKERELDALIEDRKGKVTSLEKIVKYVFYGLNVAVFMVYYGIPLIVIDGFRAAELGLTTGGIHGVKSDDHTEHAEALWKSLLFPISIVGVALKLSKIGIAEKGSSVTALMVYWSGQVLAGQIFECFEAMAFRY